MRERAWSFVLRKPVPKPFIALRRASAALLASKDGLGLMVGVILLMLVMPRRRIHFPEGEWFDYIPEGELVLKLKITSFVTSFVRVKIFTPGAPLHALHNIRRSKIAHRCNYRLATDYIK